MNVFQGSTGLEGLEAGVSLTACSVINRRKGLKVPVLPPACKSCCSPLPQDPHPCLTTPHPASRRPTWSHAEASDDANHTGDSDVAHPGQGGLRGDMGLGDATEVVALSFAPSIPKTGLHVCPSAARWPLGTMTMQDTWGRCRQAIGGLGQSWWGSALAKVSISWC